MSKENALEKYTKAVEAVDNHLNQNKPIFDSHQKLVFAVIDAENELRDAVVTANAGVKNAEFNVVVLPQTQRVYNEDKLKQMLTPTQFADVVNDVKRPPRITIKKL